MKESSQTFESLYIHVPFCHGKCDYCAFYSVTPTEELRKAYLVRLCQELTECGQACQKLKSIFIGGGTPSVLSLQEWERLGECLQRNYHLQAGYEWSVECNPESLTPELIDLLASLGVTRLSLGVQAFQEHLRQSIGRRGHLRNLEALIEHIHGSPIRELNLDLIFNIPGQTVAEWRESLEMALALAPTHLSAYALTLEENTRLTQRMQPLDDDLFLEYWHLCDEVLGKAGIQRYEISNFAVSGHECRHNLDIWHGATYLGCGPAATSFDGHLRFTNPASVTEWVAHTPPILDELSERERACEILAFGMRVVSGWRWEQYTQRTGMDARELKGLELERLEKQGLVTLTEDGAAPTEQGLLFNDDVVMALL